MGIDLRLGTLESSSHITIWWFESSHSVEEQPNLSIIYVSINIKTN